MSGEWVVPLCYCTAHFDPHIHVPDMVDSQYGLPIIPAEAAAPPPPGTVREPTNDRPHYLTETPEEWMARHGLAAPAAVPAKDTPREHDDPDCDFDGRYHYKSPKQPCPCKCHKPAPQDTPGGTGTAGPSLTVTVGGTTDYGRPAAPSPSATPTSKEE